MRRSESATFPLPDQIWMYICTKTKNKTHCIFLTYTHTQTHTLSSLAGSFPACWKLSFISRRLPLLKSIKQFIETNVNMEHIWLVSSSKCRRICVKISSIYRFIQLGQCEYQLTFLLRFSYHPCIRVSNRIFHNSTQHMKYAHTHSQTVQSLFFDGWQLHLLCNKRFNFFPGNGKEHDEWFII